MTTNNSNTQTELKIQRGIRQAEDELVRSIQDALDKTEYNNLEESQFRNLVRVADTTDSTEVIKNFLLYQVGREKKWGRGKNSLADRIIRDIDQTLKKAADNIAKSANSKNINGIWLELIRRYLGYGARYLKYKNEINHSNSR
jgi:predicted component of type VI protein secretion system